MASGQRNLPYGGVMVVQVKPNLNCIKADKTKGGGMIQPGDVLVYDRKRTVSAVDTLPGNEMYLRVGNTLGNSKDASQWDVAGIAFQGMEFSASEMSSKKVKQHPTTNAQITGTAQVVVEGAISIGDYVSVNLHDNSDLTIRRHDASTSTKRLLDELINVLVNAQVAPSDRIDTLPGFVPKWDALQNHAIDTHDYLGIFFAIFETLRLLDNANLVKLSGGIDPTANPGDVDNSATNLKNVVTSKDADLKTFFNSSMTWQQFIDNAKNLCTDAATSIISSKHRVGAYPKLHNMWVMHSDSSAQKRGMHATHKVIGKCIKVMEKVPGQGFSQQPHTQKRHIAIDICI